MVCRHVAGWGERRAAKSVLSLIYYSAVFSTSPGNTSFVRAETLTKHTSVKPSARECFIHQRRLTVRSDTPSRE